MNKHMHSTRQIQFVQLAIAAAACWILGNAASYGQQALPFPLIETAPVLERSAEDINAEPTNWVDLAVGGAIVNGDKAQFEHRYQVPARAYGGIEDLHFEQPVTTNLTLKLDGRAIFDNRDYLMKLELIDPNKGWLRGGYREYRTWYDVTGGFFPRNREWLPVFHREEGIDRGEAWFEGGLTLPNWPVITLRYSHQFRDGKKDSTSWGDTSLTGGRGTRSIVPSFRDIDEDRDVFEADVKHTIGGTAFGVGVRYEISKVDNSFNVRRSPHQSADRFVTQKDKNDSDIFNAHAFTETRFSDKVVFTTGYSFTTLDSDISGSRVYGASLDPVFDPFFGRRQQHDEGFLDLSGGSQLNQYVLNLNLAWLVSDNLTIIPSARVEKEDLDGSSHFIETDVGAGPAFTATMEEMAARNDESLVDVSERLELRYTGITNWVLYATGDWLEGTGDLTEREILAETGHLELARHTDSERFHQKYTAGANWYPLRGLNLAAQYYHKIRRTDYNHEVDSTSNALTSGNRYPAFLLLQDFDTDDVNFRVTLRPLNNLTFITRYDFQLSTIDTKPDNLPKIQTSETTTHIIGETITWAPMSRLYLQAAGNYVRDYTDTPAESRTGSLRKTIIRSKNNYWNASFTAGFALNDKTDLQGQYFYYRAPNYINNSFSGLPLGDDAEDHGVSAVLIHRLKKNISLSLRYGFFAHHDKLYGGHNDYTAHLVYSSMRWMF